MTNKTREFFSSIIKELNKANVVNPIEMIAPLANDLNTTHLQKLRGYIESCDRWEIHYSNTSGGYNDGCLYVTFSFLSAKSKMYKFIFSSNLKGNYCMGNETKETNPEFFSPLIDMVVSENVGSIAWSGNKKELIKFTNEILMEINNDKEINQLKQNIADMQRELAKLTA